MAMNRRSFLASRRRSPIFRNDRRGQTAGSVVDTTRGEDTRIRGRRGARIQGRSLWESTEGARRFLPPVTPAPWTGIRDAIAFGPRAPQPLPPHGA